MFRTVCVLCVLGWSMLCCPGVALADAIQITDLDVDYDRIEPGETFTVTVTARGGANFCLRHDHLGAQPLLPGWRSHGNDYGFLPSQDFPGPGPYKNAEICHKDNGRRDLDEREGVFRVAVDTDGWPEGIYAYPVGNATFRKSGENDCISKELKYRGRLSHQCLDCHVWI